MKKILLFLFLLLAGTVMAQELIQPHRYAPLPRDKNVRYGVLPNGLTYYIRQNALPKERAEFYIAQKVGSMLEEENQRGLAHFLEHMAFNGTTSFPGKSMLTYLESIGVKFGTNVNAYTSFDETVYNMSGVPVVREGIIDSCLLILHDWSCAISLLDSEIDNERGVIHEEWRTTTSSGLRMFEQILPVIFPDGNRYSKRLPIGLMEIIDNFPYQDLRDYYHKWYRPDQQAIIVVGDFDADKMEAKVKALFSGIKMPENPAHREYFAVADNKEPIVAIGSDKESTGAQIMLAYKYDNMSDDAKASEEAIRQSYIQFMVDQMLNRRFSELTDKPNPPFLMAQIDEGDFILAKTKQAFTAIAAAAPTEIEKALTSLVNETQRAKQFGFTQGEFDRNKANFISSIDASYAERDKQKNSFYVSQYQSNFTNGLPMPDAELNYKLFKKATDEITLDDVNRYLRSRITDDNLVVILMTIDKEGVPVPTKDQLLAIYNKAKGEKLEPYIDKVTTEPLMSQRPKAGKVTKTTTDKTFDATVWKLSNGATVVVKPTTFKDDQIMMFARSKGGNSLIPDSEVSNIKAMNSAASLGGLGQFTAEDLSKILSGKRVGTSSSVSTSSESLNASSSVKDIETMMQLVYLEFTAQGRDEDAYQSWLERTEKSFEHADADPSKILNDSIVSSLYNNNPRVTRFKKDDLAKLDYDKMLKLFSERFANAGDFVFTFVGNIDLETLKPLVEQYIASLPGNGKKEKPRDLKIELPKGEVKNYFDKQMSTPKTSVNIWYSGDCKYSLENQIRMSFLSQALRSVFTETLREEEGGTYGASASGSIDKDKNRYSLSIAFDTNTEKRDKLISIVHREIAKMAQDGPSEKDFNKIKEYMIKSYNDNLKENSFWLMNISNYYLDGTDYVNGYIDIINRQSIESIRDFAKSLVTQGNVAEVVMNGIPE